MTEFSELVPWTRLVSGIPPHVLLEDLGLLKEGCPTNLAQFLLSPLTVSLESVSRTFLDSSLHESVWTVLETLRQMPEVGPAVTDILARRIVKHGVPDRPVLLSEEGEGTWYLSIEPPLYEVPPEDANQLIRLLQLGGMMSFHSWKEAVVRIEKTGILDRTKGLFGDHWLPSTSNVYGWVFKVRQVSCS